MMKKNGNNTQSARKKIFIIAVIVIMISVTGWLFAAYYLPSRPKPLMVDIAGRGGSDTPAQFSEIKVPVTIFYPSSRGLVKEERTVAAGSLPVKMVESVLQEYFSGFKTDLKNTAVRGVYRDRNRVFYVDLSDEFRRNFSGDAGNEYYMLKSLYQTIAANISEVRDIKILIEGREVESIGGHMMILAPLQDSVSY
jgi:hypothetical protein